jgi:hypothetical protein
VTIAGKRCQAEDEAAHWQPVGLAVPGQGVGLLAVVLSYRQFVRVFVLSIGEACREATTAPASCSAR